MAENYLIPMNAAHPNGEPFHEPGLENVSLDFIPFGLLGRAASKPVLKTGQEAVRIQKIKRLEKTRSEAIEEIIKAQNALISKPNTNKITEIKSVIENNHRVIKHINEDLLKLGVDSPQMITKP